MWRRVLFVLRMQYATLRSWRLPVWCGFWFGKDHEIELGGIRLRLRSGNYMAKIADLAMAWEVIVDKVYDYYPIAANDTVLDIGGHIGSFSAKAAGLASQGKVFVCEPFPDTYAYLKANVAGFANVYPNQLAISDRGGTDSLYYSEANPAENSLVRSSGNKVEVKLLSLAEFLQQNNIDQVDLMKIDCEGAEYDILFSATAELPKIRRIVMEIHEPEYFGLSGKYSIDAMTNLLQAHDFDVQFKRENKYQGYIYASRLAAR